MYSPCPPSCPPPEHLQLRHTAVQQPIQLLKLQPWPKSQAPLRRLRPRPKRKLFGLQPVSQPQQPPPSEEELLGCARNDQLPKGRPSLQAQPKRMPSSARRVEVPVTAGGSGAPRPSLVKALLQAAEICDQLTEATEDKTPGFNSSQMALVRKLEDLRRNDSDIDAQWLGYCIGLGRGEDPAAYNEEDLKGFFELFEALSDEDGLSEQFGPRGEDAPEAETAAEGEWDPWEAAESAAYGSCMREDAPEVVGAAEEWTGISEPPRPSMAPKKAVAPSTCPSEWTTSPEDTADRLARESAVLQGPKPPPSPPPAKLLLLQGPKPPSCPPPPPPPPPAAAGAETSAVSSSLESHSSLPRQGEVEKLQGQDFSSSGRPKENRDSPPWRDVPSSKHSSTPLRRRRREVSTHRSRSPRTGHKSSRRSSHRRSLHRRSSAHRSRDRSRSRQRSRKYNRSRGGRSRSRSSVRSAPTVKLSRGAQMMRHRLMTIMTRGVSRLDPAECQSALRRWRHLEQMVEVRHLRHTHCDVSPTFKSGPHRGQLVSDLSRALQDGYPTHNIKPMVVVRNVSEFWVVCGNRRLKALKDFQSARPDLDIRAPCIVHDVNGASKVPQQLMAKCLAAMSTENEGTFASFRSGPREHGLHGL